MAPELGGGGGKGVVTDHSGGPMVKAAAGQPCPTLLSGGCSMPSLLLPEP